MAQLAPLIGPREVSKAIQLASDGVPLRAIQTALAVPGAVWRLLMCDPAFREPLEAARRLALEHLADRLLRVHRWKDKAAAKLYSDNLKFLLERRLPESYGRRDEVRVSVGIDLRASLEGRRRRIEEGEEDVVVESEVDRLCS